MSYNLCKMRELNIAGAIILVIAMINALFLFQWRDVAMLGTWLTVGGFVLGVPAGFVYHFQLYRALKPLGKLPRGWIWRPIQLNSSLQKSDRKRVLPWCYVGGLGFFAIVIGLVVFCVGMVIAGTSY